MQEFTASLEKHYSEWPSLEAIVENLSRKGIDLGNVRPPDLYPYDQSHAGGIEATVMLAERAGIQAQARVLDIGCGIGGAARYLRHQYGCRVLGIDLTPARLRIGAELNRLSGCSEGIDLLVALAERLPVRSGFADVVWTQHLTMNLPDHRGFVRECARVLKSSGRLALHEWFLTHREAAARLTFPMPWAHNPALNHAIGSDEFLRLLRDERFLLSSEDVTAAMLERLRKDIQALAARGAPAPRIAAHENLVAAASEGTLHCLMIVSEPFRS